MRRIACTLAILGITLQPVLGADPFAPASSGVNDAKSTGRSLQFFSANADKTGEKTPKRFTRSGEKTPEAAKQPGDELKNYYSELFGKAPAHQLDETASDRSRLTPVAAEAPTEAPARKVVQAEYERDSAQKGSMIEQVRADDDARPFPGFNPQPKTTNHSFTGTADRTPVSRASLTNPIQVDNAPAVPANTTPIRTTSNRGTLSFTSARPKSSSNNALGRENQNGAQNPAVSIEWVKKSGINVGQECRCDLVIKNTGRSTAKDVVVEAFFPKNVRLIKSVPMPDKSTEFLGWEFAELQMGEQRVIEVTMIPLERGTIDTHAEVRFSGTASRSFTVAEPLLAVKLDGPGQVMVGEPAPVTVNVSNPGTGIAHNVVIEAIVPQGLEHTRGERLLMELGSLNPGETRSVRLALTAAAGGRHNVQVQTRGGHDLLQNSSTEVSVVAPSLLTKIDGPGLRYLGRQGKYTLSVGNDGAAASNNVRVMYKIPEGFKFVSADRGAEFDSTTRLLNWFVGRLDQNQQAQITVTLEATAMGAQTHLVRATTEHGAMKDAELVTSVEGTSSLSIEVVDLDDPVETGTEAIYEIRVKNEGSASAHNVGVACELAPGMRYLAADGPSAHIAENGQVVFRAIPELGPEQQTIYRVQVTSNTAGHARFRARLSSESVAEPLTAEELTKFYGEQ